MLLFIDKNNWRNLKERFLNRDKTFKKSKNYNLKEKDFIED